MINEERFWESAIAEAVRNDPPPDVTASVLAGLAQPETEPVQETAPRGRLRLIRVLAELTAAAAVVFAIAWLTGLLQVPEGAGSTDDADKLDVAAAPGADYEIAEGVILLRGGWLLVSTGAPDVRSGDSILSRVDGRVLIHAPGVPTRGQAEAVTGWLEANRLELEMIGDIKLWARGTVLAALVLSGSAMLDGQKIEGPKPENAPTTEWHVVRSVMDIDNLPKGVRFVNAGGLDAAHLDFLAEVETLEGISLRDGTGLRAEHLEGLKSLKKLWWLDIRGVGWASVADMRPLHQLTALKRVGVDLIPESYVLDGVEYFYSSGEGALFRRGLMTWYSAPGDAKAGTYDYGKLTLPAIKQLSDKGIEIELGRWRAQSQEQVSEVVAALPTMTSMMLSAPTVGMLKMVSEHVRLRSLELERYDAGELGLAYLARRNTVQHLSIEADEISVDEVHQISRMGLTFLHINARVSGSPDQTLARIATMKQLRELELRNLDIFEAGPEVMESFASREPLDRLWLENSIHEPLLVAHLAPTRRLEIRSNDPLGELSADLELVKHGKAGASLEVIRFEFDETAEFNDSNYGEEHLVVLKSYPNLKRIEVRRGGFERPTMEDELVRWLRANLPKIEVVVTP